MKHKSFRDKIISTSLSHQACNSQMIYRYLVMEMAQDIINKALKCHDKNGKRGIHNT